MICLPTWCWKQCCCRSCHDVCVSTGCCKCWRDAGICFVSQGATQKEPAYHHEHPKAGSTNLHKNIGQAFQNGYVAGDHCRNGDCWIEVASGHIGSDVDCRTSKISGDATEETVHDMTST